MAISTAAASDVWSRYRGGLAAKTSTVPRWEIAAFTAAMFVALVHFVDATTIHWQRGASPPERAVQTALAFAIPVLAALAYPYLKCGWRVVLSLIFGYAAISTGVVIHVVGPIKNSHVGSGEYTGFAWLAAGVLLVFTAVPVLFASLPGWRWRIAALPVAVVVVLNVLFPAVIAVYGTHAPRYIFKDIDVGRPYENVSFETSDGLTIRASYVPSQNGAAVVLMHGSGGARIRPVDHARMLVSNGYGVLLVDARGHGESEGRTNAFGWGSWPDAIAAAEFLKARPDVQDGRVGLLGVSMGGEIGLDAAARTDAFQAVVSDGAGLYSINELRSLPLTWRRALEYPAHVIVNGMVSVMSDTSVPPALKDRVGRIETPTMLISSNVKEERDLNRIWRDRMTVPVELWELPDVGHTGGIKEHPEEYETRVVGFLDAHLLP